MSPDGLCLLPQEDFQSLTYGFNLASEVSDSRAIGMLKEVEDELFKMIKVPLTHPLLDTSAIYFGKLHSWPCILFEFQGIHALIIE